MSWSVPQELQTGILKIDETFQNTTSGLMSAMGLRFSPAGAFDDAGNPLADVCNHTQCAKHAGTNHRGDASQPVQMGSVELTTNGGIDGFAILRSNGQEAIIPLAGGMSGASMLWFDNTNGYATSVAVANGAPEAASIPKMIRNVAAR
jgi:hypothetical protein